jgi:hypothetical protein
MEIEKIFLKPLLKPFSKPQPAVCDAAGSAMANLCMIMILIDKHRAYKFVVLLYANQITTYIVILG